MVTRQVILKLKVLLLLLILLLVMLLLDNMDTCQNLAVEQLISSELMALGRLQVLVEYRMETKEILQYLVQELHGQLTMML